MQHNIYLQLLNFFHLYIKHAVSHGEQRKVGYGRVESLSQCVCRGLYSGPSAIRHLFQRRSVKRVGGSTWSSLALLSCCLC